MTIDVAAIPPGKTRPETVRISVTSFVGYLDDGQPAFAAYTRDGLFHGAFAGDEDFAEILKELGIAPPTVRLHHT